MNIRRHQSTYSKFKHFLPSKAKTLGTNENISDEPLQTFMDAGFDNKAAIEVAAGSLIMKFTSIFNHINKTVIDFPEPDAILVREPCEILPIHLHSMCRDGCICSL